MDYISVLSLYLTLTFGIGIFFGYSIQLWGDVLAVLLVGLGSIIVQATLMSSAIDVLNWVVWSVIGTTIGIAISFLAIEILIKFELVALDDSHLVTFPFTLAGLITAQYIQLSNSYDPSIAYSWVVYSAIGFGLALLVILLLNIFVDFEFDILQTREGSFSAVFKWAFLGLLLGLSYSIFTSRIFLRL